jgi:hypothetical protein
MNRPIHELKSLLDSDFINMREDGMRKAIAGMTTIEEVLRATPGCRRLHGRPEEPRRQALIAVGLMPTFTSQALAADGSTSNGSIMAVDRASAMRMIAQKGETALDVQLSAEDAALAAGQKSRGPRSPARNSPIRGANSRQRLKRVCRSCKR